MSPRGIIKRLLFAGVYSISFAFEKSILWRDLQPDGIGIISHVIFSDLGKFYYRSADSGMSRKRQVRGGDTVNNENPPRVLTPLESVALQPVGADWGVGLVTVSYVGRMILITIRWIRLGPPAKAGC